MNLSLGGSGRPVLPVSDPPLSGENDTSDGKGVDDRLFKGYAMTKHSAYAALSYMAALVINLIQFLVFHRNLMCLLLTLRFGLACFKVSVFVYVVLSFN